MGEEEEPSVFLQHWQTWHSGKAESRLLGAATLPVFFSIFSQERFFNDEKLGAFLSKTHIFSAL